MRSHSIKIIISLIFLLTIVLSISFYATKTLSSSSKKLESYIVNIEYSSKNNDWNMAAQELSKLENSWNEIEKTWAMLIDHIEIDNIDSTLARLKQYIETKNETLTFAEISALRLYITHIPEKESLDIKNIL